MCPNCHRMPTADAIATAARLSHVAPETAARDLVRRTFGVRRTLEESIEVDRQADLIVRAHMPVSASYGEPEDGSQLLAAASEPTCSGATE